MKQIVALTLIVLLLCGLCACAAREPSADVPSDRETAAAPLDRPSETRKDPEPTETQKAPEPTEAQTDPRPQNEPEWKNVSLTLPYMETEDYFSFRPEDGERSADLSLRIPADWTEDAGLFYCPQDDGVRKVLEPICLLREMDDAQWEKLARFDVTGIYGDIEFLSVSSGVDANGREYIQLLAKSWPEGGTITLWYPCFCFLRETSGTAVVLTDYLLDPEDQSAKETLREILDSIRLE